MKKSILLFGVLISSFVFAQKTSFGVKTGINLARPSENLLAGFWASNRLGFVSGVYVNVPLNDKFSFQPEMIYSAQGDKENTFYAAQVVSGVGNVELFDVEVLNKLDYLSIPLMFQFKIVDEFYLQAGPQLSFLINAKQKSSVSSMFINNNPAIPKASEVDIKDQVNSVDFSFNLGLGYKTKVGLNFDARYNLGLSDIESNQSPNTNQHRVWQFTVGYDIIKNKQ
jgi:hypothetical protein